MTSTAKSSRSATSSAPPVASKRKKLRKEDIVLEATKLFAERGYEGASMGDLAERVGLRKASLFHHFPSKDALYETVLEHLLAGIKASIETAALSEGSFEERLDRLADAVVSQLGAQPHAARLLVREAMDWGPVMRDRLATVIQEVLGAALEFGRRGQREGAFRYELDMTQVVVSLMGILVLPFAVGEVVEGFAGCSPFDPAFVEARRVAVRAHVRCMLAGNKK